MIFLLLRIEIESFIQCIAVNKYVPVTKIYGYSKMVMITTEHPLYGGETIYYTCKFTWTKVKRAYTMAQRPSSVVRCPSSVRSFL